MNNNDPKHSSALEDMAIWFCLAAVLLGLGPVMLRKFLATHSTDQLVSMALLAVVTISILGIAAIWLPVLFRPTAPSNVREYRTKRFPRDKVRAAEDTTPPGHFCLGLVHATEQPSKSLPAGAALYVPDSLHTFISGSTGCGKSSLLAALIALVLRFGWSVVHVTAKPDRATIATADEIADARGVAFRDLVQNAADSIRPGTFNPLHGLDRDATQAVIEGVYESADPFFRNMGKVAAQGIIRALSNPTIAVPVSFPNIVDVMFDENKLRAAARFDKRLLQFLDDKGREKFQGVAPH